MNTYTIAKRDYIAECFRPVEGIPRNMTYRQAQQLAAKARNNGLDVVAFNMESI